VVVLECVIDSSKTKVASYFGCSKIDRCVAV
jgi:hypothetical protein